MGLFKKEKAALFEAAFDKTFRLRSLHFPLVELPEE